MQTKLERKEVFEKIIMKPLIKYPGGKIKELRVIRHMLPSNINNYYEPFVGGGAVLWSLKLGNIKYINDISRDLINFYLCVQLNDEEFYQTLERWNIELQNATFNANEQMEYLSDAFWNNKEPNFEDEELKEVILKKFDHIQRKAAKNDGVIEDFEENIEAAYKQAVYTKARREYNEYKNYDGKRAALYVLMRQYSFSGMFRYNSDGYFNIPYGGIAYNDIYLDDKIRIMKSDEVRTIMDNMIIGNVDFELFMMQNPPRQGDFIFVDPPYDTTFSSYDNKDFDRLDQHRLANYLIFNCYANWMVVIKATEFIRNLYPKGRVCANGGIIKIMEFDKRYDLCMKGRNEQRSEHLLITNYL